jgi:hypothetical protein
MSIFNRMPPSNERMTISDKDAFTLPKQVRYIRVLSGTAWVSVGREDVIVRPAETLYLTKPGVVITALGQKRLEFEMIA